MSMAGRGADLGNRLSLSQLRSWQATEPCPQFSKDFNTDEECRVTVQDRNCASREAY